MSSHGNGLWSLGRSPPSTEVWLRRSEEHTSELQSRPHLVCRLLLEKKKKTPSDVTPQTSNGQPIPHRDGSWHGAVFTQSHLSRSASVRRCGHQAILPQHYLPVPDNP